MFSNLVQDIFDLMLFSDKEYEKQRIKCHEKLETQEWKKAIERQVKKEV